MPDRQTSCPTTTRARRRYVRGAATAVLFLTLAFMQILPRPDALSSDASMSRVLELAFIAIGVARAMTIPAIPGHAVSDTARLGGTIVFAFAGWAFLSAVWSALTLTAAVKALELAALTAAAYKLIAAAPGRGAEARQALCDGCTVGLLLSLGALLCTNVVSWGTPLHFETGMELDLPSELGRERLVLGYNHPLACALYLAMMAVFLVNSSAGMVARLMGLAVLLSLLWLCDARGTSTALPVAFLICWFLRSRPSLPNAWAVVMAIFASVGGILILLPYLDIGALLQKGFGDDVTSLNSRTDLWAYALHLAVQHPLGGVGYFGAREELLGAFPFAGHAHNTFLEIFLTTGLPGATLLIALVALALVTLVRSSDPLLGGLLPLILVEGNLNPVLLVPGPPMLIFMVALFGAVTAPRTSPLAALAAREPPPGRRLALEMRR